MLTGCECSNLLFGSELAMLTDAKLQTCRYGESSVDSTIVCRISRKQAKEREPSNECIYLDRVCVNPTCLLTVEVE